MHLVLLFAFVVTCRGSSIDKQCSGDTVPDLDGAWVCDDAWLLDVEEGTSDYDEAKTWNLYFELPKFYAVSKIRILPSACDSDVSYVIRLSASVWDERFVKQKGVKLSDNPKSRWAPVNIEDVNFVGNGSQEYTGFARRAPYWRFTTETVGINDECLPKLMFFARAGVAAMQHFVMEMDFPFEPPPRDAQNDRVNAPAGNTCDRVTSVPSEAVSRYRLDTSFYRKYTTAYGIPVMGSNRVDDRALQRACYVVRFMLADRQDVRDHMYRNKGRVAIIGRRETVPMVPEMRQYTWWTRRAAGGTFHNPVNVGAEENMLCERGDGYARNQDIFMHEFAHGMHLIACHTAIPNFNSRLQRSFNYARSRGLWTNTYANTDNREYFAEGVQAFFEQQREGPVGGDGIQNHIDTREELRRHDPTLYQIIDELFPCYNDYIPRCDDISQGQGLGQDLKFNCKGGGGSTVRPGTTKNPGSCADDNQSCARWAGSGECQKNPDYMLVSCKKSCKTCTTKPTESSSKPPTTTKLTPTSSKPPTTTKLTSTTTTTSPSSTAVPGPCSDDDNSCSYWASNGECTKNPGYMKVNCKKSCGECSGSSCVDTDTRCNTWGTYCSFNDYVIKNCRKTCGKC